MTTSRITGTAEGAILPAPVFFTPTAEAIAWARTRIGGPEASFSLLATLKCLQKMPQFCARSEIPEVAVDHVRRCSGSFDPALTAVDFTTFDLAA
ncbi:hypothetical protein AB0B25_29000 [Nocardia sp. NPDC049190]|uniref:hypothetical protein n=1 Tax=Nocardia sp. NPDC049190 TaxID=3155650 RepID=UPI0033E5E4A3